MWHTSNRTLPVHFLFGHYWSFLKEIHIQSLKKSVSLGIRIKLAKTRVWNLNCWVCFFYNPFFSFIQRYALGFFERGGYYEEKISIDRERRIIEYDVPAHANVLAGKYVKDLKSVSNGLKFFILYDFFINQGNNRLIAS